MLDRLHENLVRISGSLNLLHDLLTEEYRLLTEHEPKQVARLELSIQELLRQVTSEKELTVSLVAAAHPGGRLAGLLESLDPQTAAPLKDLTGRIEEGEKTCKFQAGLNSTLAMGLWDQSSGLLKFLHDQVRPKNQDTYSGKARFENPTRGPALISGRT